MIDLAPAGGVAAFFAPPPLPWLERAAFAVVGVEPERDEQSWRQYAGALLLFSALTLLATYAILRLQDRLPANPKALAAVEPWLAANTAASFTTNTNWQN